MKKNDWVNLGLNAPPEVTRILWWERVILKFLPKTTICDEGITLYAQKFRGKTYISSD